VIDPELGVNIVDLGLVYSAEVEDGHVRVAITVTTPACPLQTYITGHAESVIWKHVREAQSVDIQLVWTPPWRPAMMSSAAREQLGWAR
jgi:metal-sulfur cluster biosynthetic enzyme